MNTENVKVGDKLFGVIHKYDDFSNYMNDIRIVEFEVVKVNPKSFKIAFNADTRRWPQLMRKGDIETIDPDKKRLAARTILHIEEKAKWPDDLKKRCIRYCQRIINAK